VPKISFCGKEKAQYATTCERSATLTNDISDGFAKRKALRGEKSPDSPQDLGARRKCLRLYNHCEHYQTEGQRNADMRNCTASRFVDHNRARPGKDESERFR